MYSEKEDLFKLIHSLSKTELKEFKTYSKGINSKVNNIAIQLFNYIKKQSAYKESYLIAKLKINKQQFRDSKFHLFNTILESLKRGRETNSRIVLLNKAIEIQILIQKGLLKRASRKYKKLKNILIIKEEYDLLTFLNSNTEILKTYNVSEDKVIEMRLKNRKESEYYLELSKNLKVYRKLSDEVLGLSYSIGGRASQSKNQLLDYLKHPLLAGEHMAKSDLARYVFYEIKCLIYLGINDYENSSVYSLKCLKYLNSISSPFRNDYNLLLASYSNFLIAQLILKNINVVEQYMTALDKLILKNKARLKFAMQVKTFETRTTVFLSYLSVTKNFIKFESVYNEIIKEYDIFKTSISPNFNAHIIFHISKLFFFGGKLEEALNWCNILSNIQRSNPTYSVIINGYLLRIIIHFEMGNLKIIPHLVSSAEYFSKSHSQLLKVEQYFMNGINKIKPFHSEQEKTALLKKLCSKIKLTYANSNESKTNSLIDIVEWLQSKISASNNS